MQPPLPPSSRTEPPQPSRLRRRAVLTPVILAINVAVFAAQMIASGSHVWESFSGTFSGRPFRDAVSESLALWAPAVWDGQVWRLLTAAFLHFGGLHLFVNMFVLWDIGRLCELVVGPLRYGFIYLASALGGTIASTLFTGGLSGGASGALFGLSGALLVLVLLDREHRIFAQRDRLRSMLVRFIVLNVILQFVIPFVDIAAHMGGLVAGAVTGALVFGWSRVAGPRGPIIRWTATAALIVLVAVGAYALHPVGLPRFERWRSSPDAVLETILQPR